MNQEHAEQFLFEDIPQALFHVETTDYDDHYGVRLDELILIRLISENPQILRYKRLSEIVDLFITKQDEYNDTH